MTNQEKIETQLEILHYEARTYICDMWRVDIEDYGREYNAFILEVGGVILSLQDMIRILEYKITKEIVRERRDMVSGGFYSDRVKEAMKQKHPHDNLIKHRNIMTFWKNFGNKSE